MCSARGPYCVGQGDWLVLSPGALHNTHQGVDVCGRGLVVDHASHDADSAAGREWMVCVHAVCPVCGSFDRESDT